MPDPAGGEGAGIAGRNGRKKARHPAGRRIPVGGNERGGDRILHGDKGKPGGKKTAVSFFRFAAGEIRESQRAAINFPEPERRIFGKSFRKTAGTGMARVANGAGRTNAFFEHHQTGKGSA
ncbi:MAG: hypothetical protein C6W57_00980 [Caldibacillus debilis]|nr:MAG: hypothetical protein C6W57_00980 [Caldibacillus debilis]